jgi:hypothetical protein
MINRFVSHTTFIAIPVLQKKLPTKYSNSVCSYPEDSGSRSASSEMAPKECGLEASPVDRKL